jgi:mannose-1-phosphate guanylyltransferase/mannose-1-phosphate guanylyltransferase/mannose-6-phosphate isomerase
VKGACEVARFTEKPDLAAARRFLRSGRFAWNSGLFLFRADTFADRLARFLPEVDRRIREAFRGGRKGAGRRLRDAYRGMPSVSVDYGILEKEHGILVLPADMGWSDLGTWRSLHEFLGGAGGNVTFGDAILEDCRDCLARTDAGVVAVLGMDGVVVVRSGDAVLVCPRSRSEEVKWMAEEVRRRFPGLA